MESCQPIKRLRGDDDDDDDNNNNNFNLFCFQNSSCFHFIYFSVGKEIFIVLTRQAPSYWNESSCRGLQQQLAGLAQVILHIRLFKL